MPSSSSTAPPPLRALLFDIGGVLVRSPMLSIRTYESAHSIPSGYINHAISTSAPNGAWQRLERGEMLMDDGFFADFRKDLMSEEVWRAYLRRRSRGGGAEQEAKVPDIDAKKMFMDMMTTSQAPEQVMFDAVTRLKADRRLLIAALSNTTIFPASHPYFSPELHGAGGRKLQSDDVAASDGQDAAKSSVKRLFDIYISSAHVGMRKPEKRIYSLALRWLNEEMARRGERELKAEEVLFLDDIGANLKPARELGMRTLKVGLGRGEPERAVREVESMVGVRLRGESAAKL